MLEISARYIISAVSESRNLRKRGKIIRVWAAWATWNANMRRRRKILETHRYRRLLSSYLACWASVWAKRRRLVLRAYKLVLSITNLKLRQVVRNWKRLSIIWGKLDVSAKPMTLISAVSWRSEAGALQIISEAPSVRGLAVPYRTC